MNSGTPLTQFPLMLASSYPWNVCHKQEASVGTWLLANSTFHLDLTASLQCPLPVPGPQPGPCITLVVTSP